MKSSNNWMKALSDQFEHAYKRRSDKPLMLLLDIDGTILDMRHMMLAVLQSYDRTHNTNFFERLRIKDIDVHENQIDAQLDALKVPEEEHESIHSWFFKQRWTAAAIRQMHRPFQGVLDVIRWFQLQPNTTVGLVTGRPDTYREDTLRSLNKLGKPHRVSFTEELLYMNSGDWEEGIPDVKVSGLRHFRDAGYHVFAFIDNEPSNLKALAAADPEEEVLLLHADTIFESKRMRVPRGTVRGKDYRLTELIPDEKALPAHVQLAWHGVNDEANLRQFLASEVQWVEVDARLEPASWQVILRHDSFDESPLEPEEEWFKLSDVLKKVETAGRAIKIDLKNGGMLLDKVLELLTETNLSDQDLWFNANIEQLMEGGFRRLISTHPNAIVQCPSDFLSPLIEAAPVQALETLKILSDWGINRFSISWARPHLRELFDQMEQWGYQVNIYNVPDLESFLQAVLLLPRSVTSDFNFPQWHYYGHGAGKGGKYYEYKMSESKGRIGH